MEDSGNGNLFSDQFISKKIGLDRQLNTSSQFTALYVETLS